MTRSWNVFVITWTNEAWDRRMGRKIHRMVGSNIGWRYYCLGLRFCVTDSLACSEAEAVFLGKTSRKLPPSIQQAARRKLVYLSQVMHLDDLRSLSLKIMKTKLLDPVHPGEILLEDFMKPLGLSQYRVAKDVGVAPLRISEIVRSKRGITADTAMRLGRYFKTSPGIWMRLQAQYDLEVAERKNGAEILRSVPEYPVSD